MRRFIHRAASPPRAQSERDNWFVYRAAEVDDGLDIHEQLAAAYPFATIVGADTAVAVGCSNERVFGDAGVVDTDEKAAPPGMVTPVRLDDAAALAHAASTGTGSQMKSPAPGGGGGGGGARWVSTPSFPHRSVSLYESAYVFLGSGLHAHGRGCYIAPQPPRQGSRGCNRLLRPGSVGHAGGDSTAPVSLSAALPNHVYVYPAARASSASWVRTSSCTVGEGPRPQESRPNSFCVWVARFSTRFVPVGGVAEEGAGRPVGRSVARSVGHPLSAMGPSLSHKFDAERPVDDCLRDPSLSPVVCLTLTLAPQPLGVADTAAAGGDGDVLSLCAWMTRRCSVNSVGVAPQGIADACLDWQERATDLITNRLKWMYWITLLSENPGDSSDLWPAQEGRRSRRTSMSGDITVDHGAGGGAAGGGGGGAGGTGVTYGLSGGGRRGSIFAPKVPPRYRKLLRSTRAPEFVVPPSQRVVNAALITTEDANRFKSGFTRRDSFDVIDVDAEHVPLPSRMYQKKKKDVAGEPHRCCCCCCALSVFVCVSLCLSLSRVCHSMR
jgi:hypothetical protein